MFGFVKGWLFLLVLFLLPFFSANAAAYIQVPFSHPPSANGPGYDLQREGYPLKALQYLRHSNGKLIRRSEYRNLNDKHYYLPSNIKSLLAKKTATRRLLRKVGVRGSRVKILNNEIKRLNEKVISQLKVQNQHLKDMMKTMVPAKDLKQAQDNLAAEKLANQNKVSPWWVALAALFTGVLAGIIAYKKGQSSSLITGIGTDPAELSNLRTQITNLKNRAQNAEHEAQELRGHWNDIHDVRDRLTVLEQKSTHRTTSTPL